MLANKIYTGFSLAMFSVLFVLVPGGGVSAATITGIQNPEGFVLLSEVDPTIQQEIRYFGDYNFMGHASEGYEVPACVLTIEAAQALKKVQANLADEGLGLKVYDCYRPQRAVNEFVRWAEDQQDTKMQEQFYPSVPKDRLFEEGYIAAQSGHSRGSTVDLTIVVLGHPSAGEPSIDTKACGVQPGIVPNGDELDMGSGFDCFGLISHPSSTLVNEHQQENRQRLMSAMGDQGFAVLDTEWWHYTLRPEPFPNTYFDFPITDPLFQNGILDSLGPDPRGSRGDR
ncbi:M15 family metallopeptidase [Lysinibacter sp. HNR]|uniref:M15 family metallopeptidase n=1 Tax=Lysinibacter sp. HNR TaxID=3031408 RepID=UPI002434904D|nr:M15 family metallopeptidase [Lysinibacter sp. HNR]WGD37707.1 M15 family metallopeptidase [Lysinibacter sp. HNR]